MITRKDFLARGAAALAAPITAQGASIGVSGRARGLLGGAFMGCMMAQQGHSEWRNDGKMHLWYSLNDDNFGDGVVSIALHSKVGTGHVEWGDGSSSTISTTSFSHTYSASGDYEIVISGFSEVSFGYNGFGSGNTRITKIEFGLPVKYVSTGSWFSSLPSLSKVNLCGNSCAIGSSCFSGDSSLEEVVGGENVTAANEYAFRNCSSLIRINLQSCTSYGYAAFMGCSSLKEVGDISIASTISSNAFSGCTSLEFDTLRLPNITRLENTCFGDGSVRFRTLICPNVEYIGYQCLINDALTTIGDMPRLETIAPWYAMNGKYIRTVGSMEAVTSIHSYSFGSIGSKLTADQDGIKTTINANQPMDTWMSISGFPWSAPTTTKFVCTDGYIRYSNGAWTKFPNA